MCRQIAQLPQVALRCKVRNPQTTPYEQAQWEHPKYV